jgi:ABC-2 type transport system permease protein
MDKFAMIMGPILAGGVIIDERARGALDLMLSKPITVEDYYVCRVLAACAAVATFYTTASLAAVLTFPMRLPDFDATAFAALCLTNLLAITFAAIFSGFVATLVRRKLTSVLVSFMVLATLVGCAFLGFFYPALTAASHLNPYFLGVKLIGRIEAFGWADVAGPAAALLAMNAAVLFAGRALARRNLGA